MPVAAEGARKDASINAGRRLHARFKTFGVKKVLRSGAMLKGLCLGADVTWLLLPGVFCCSLKPPDPFFPVQNFSEAINTSFLD